MEINSHKKKITVKVVNILDNDTMSIIDISLEDLKYLALHHNLYKSPYFILAPKVRFLPTYKSLFFLPWIVIASFGSQS
jgi:hypothetical protein